MAIKKSVQTPHGVTADYHKLTNVVINALKNSVEMQFAIYASTEARDAGSIPLWNEFVTVPLSQLSPNTLQFLYPLALETPMFEDGVSDVAVDAIITRTIPVAVEVDADPHKEARAAALASLPKTGAK
jgi:hypothetical protein